jgi:DNA topoisomerase-1
MVRGNGTAARALREARVVSNLPTPSRANGNNYKRLYVLQAADCARAAGLRYVGNEGPGIRRVRAGDTFRYIEPDGRAVRDGRTLARIRSLAVPPAWSEVWICPLEDGHVQATGRDARGRKQYRYHRRWREIRDETKYGRLLAFAKALPKIHRRVARDLRLPGLPRDKALAVVVRLLETSCIRVGNEEYARDNESFGLTTLRDRQVRVRGATLQFRFRGKSRVKHDVELSDRQLARIVRGMQDLPGYELFQYVDETGENRRIESSDVNAYLKESAGEDFTSKDFRTWGGTLQAAETLRRMPRCSSAAEAKRHIGAAVEQVAKQLGNTKAVCRKCYIHPAVLEAYTNGTLHALAGRSAAARLTALLKRAQRTDAKRVRRSGANGRSLAPVLAQSLQRRAARNGTALAHERLQ